MKRVAKNGKVLPKQRTILIDHYAISARGNDSHLGKKRRTRSRVMPKNITFDQLRSVMAKRAGGSGLPSKMSMGNARTALVGLTRALQLDMGAKVGATLREGFPAALEEFRRQLRRLGRGRQSINNKTSSLNQWATLVRML